MGGVFGANALLQWGAILGVVIWLIVVQVNTSDNSSNINKLEGDVNKLDSATNPTTIPDNYGAQVISLVSDEDDADRDDGSGRSDSRDSAIRAPTLMGRVIAIDDVDKHGVVQSPGYWEVSVPVSVYDKNITVHGDGSIVTPTLSKIKNEMVCASEVGGIAIGRAVGYTEEGCIKEGFSTYESWVAAEGIEATGVTTFGIDTNTTAVVYPNAASMLAIKLQSRDDITKEVTTSSEAIIDTGVFTFFRDCSIQAVSYPGNADHFVVVWEEQAGGNGLLATTCSITSSFPTLVIACTGVPVAIGAGTDVTPTGIEYVAATEFAVTFTSGATGANVVALSSTPTTLVTAWNTPLVLNAAVVNPNCFQSSIAVRGSQVYTAYGDDVAGVIPEFQIADLAGVVLTSAGPATAISTSDKVVFDMTTWGPNQVAFITFQDLSATTGFMSAYTTTAVGINLLSSDTAHISSVGVLGGRGRPRVSLTQISESVVVASYHSTRAGYSEVIQAFELYFEAASPRISTGDANEFSRNLVDDLECVPYPGALDNAFACVFTESISTISDDFDVRTVIGTVGAFTTYQNGRNVDLVHTAPNSLMGISTTAAGPGELIHFLVSGDLTNPDFTLPPATTVCAHCDGSIRATGSPDDIHVCEPVCVCISTGTHSIDCGHLSTNSPHGAPY